MPLFIVSNSTNGCNFQPNFLTDEERRHRRSDEAFEAVCFHHAIVRIWPQRHNNASIPSPDVVLSADFQFDPNHHSNNEITRLYKYLPHQHQQPATWIIVKRVG